MSTVVLEGGPITELTYKELKGMIDPNYLRARERTHELRKRGVRYKGLVGSSMIFRTMSSKYPENGIIWEQEVKLLDLVDTLKRPDTSLRDRVLAAMQGEVALRCNCPSFLYWGFAYITGFFKAAAPGRTYDPKWPAVVKKRPGAYPSQPWRRRNYLLKGVMCKHLGLVMEVFGAHWTSLLRELKNQGYE